MFAIKIVKTAGRRYKIAPLANASILGREITAKRAISPAKTAEQQTKIAPLAIAPSHGMGRIAQHVRCNKAVVLKTLHLILSVVLANVML